MAFIPTSTTGLSAPFNMAIDTLMRLGRILDKVTLVGIDPMLTQNLKQQTKVYLVKQFFVQASPLLNPDVVVKYTPTFNSLRPNERMIATTRSGIIKKKEVKSLFDWDLEEKLDKFLLDIQTELQNEKYFMPPKNDPRFGWKYE
jgi:hypothetical protein